MLSDLVTINTFNRLGVFHFVRPMAFKRKLKNTAPLFFPRSVERQGLLELIIAFAGKSLRQICENEEDVIAAFGSETAEIFKKRLADLRAAEHVKDLPKPPYPLKGARGGCMAIEFAENQRLVFNANHTKNPRDNNGKVDWAKVRRVKILEIESGFNNEQ